MKFARSPRFKPSTIAPIDIAGDALNAAQVLSNLTTLCRTHWPNRRDIELVDVFVDVVKDPKRALADGVFMTPTLVRLAPPPTQSLVGTPSQIQTVLQPLILEVPAA
ncbi:MAG: hypothetical protein GZ085_05195 [Sulfuriferula multivorans]|uniref:KaiB domain-containing protein n=1 Tax=Sulfuriferula multivorans TaxID=1559896 RepID=A0A7C9P4L9_9PROT|nr:hypothetical protein [Sulfuriferula multivorans]